MKIVLYGAGNYCKSFLKLQELTGLEVLCIVDKNPQKWGEYKEGYKIISPKELEMMQYEKLIVTAYNYDSVLTDIQRSRIPLDNVYIYEAEKNVIMSIKDIYIQYLEKKIFYMNAGRQIKSSLLMEAIYAKEFDGFNRVVVFGTKEDFQFLQEFFEVVSPGTEVIRRSENIVLTINDKCVFCESDYWEQMKEFGNKFNSDKQWIIMPFFDVHDTIIL